MRKIIQTSFVMLATLSAQQALAAECGGFSGQAINAVACADPTSARFLARTAKAIKMLERVIPTGARPALRSHQNKWELFADAWLASNQTAGSSSGPLTSRCSSPRALLFQRMDTIEKAIATVRETKPKSVDLCYDNAACLEPGATNTEMICETIHLGIEGVPANAEAIVVNLLGQWVAQGRPFETHIIKSSRNQEPCETVSENTMVEYIRGGFVTVRTRQGDTCNPQAGSEQIATYDLRSGRALTIADFANSPAELLAILRKRKEGDVLQSLLRLQINGDKTRANIEPAECAQLPFTTLNDVNVHFTSDGLRINKLFKKTSRELASCQFKVEEGLSPSAVAQLLKGKSTPASALLRYIK
ncbi:hypothetical protein EBU99_05500 [bacterium]|nr:hypothetical protein [bacterium]